MCNDIKILGTHYVQDINTTNSTLTPGVVDISCEFIASNATTLGYVALVYSEKEDHYLVTENSNLGVVTNHLEGLDSDNYSTLLYAINESGLPLQQAAAFPRNITIIGNKTEGNFHCCCNRVPCYAYLPFKNRYTPRKNG